MFEYTGGEKAVRLLANNGGIGSFTFLQFSAENL
jgi:hypothetical protein